MAPFLFIIFWTYNLVMGGDVADGTATKTESDDEFDNENTNDDDDTYYPVYTYRYNVYDPLTEDFKSQQETRAGNVVKGFYAVMDADGIIREVHYTADKENGFRATVKKNGKVQHFPGPAPEQEHSQAGLFR